VVLTATDNCGNATVDYKEQRTNGNCANNYTLTRTWTASDVCGNTTVHVQTVTVQDTTKPVFVESLPQDEVVCAVAPEPVVLTATDNCGQATVTYSEEVDDESMENVIIYNRTWTASDACGNITAHTQTIRVNQILNTQLDITICDGESVQIGENVYTASGTYTNTLTSSLECDSIVVLNLTVHPLSYTVIDSTICLGREAFVYNGISYEESGTYVLDTLQNSLGCDSIITLNLVARICEPSTQFADRCELVPVKSTLTICNVPAPVAEDIVITSIDESTTGTTALGAWTIDEQGCFVYTADDLKGIDTITLRACSDELNECVETRFIIHLIGLASVANRDSVKIEPNTFIDINVLANDVSMDEDNVALCSESEVVVGPSHGTAVPNGDGTITYRPVTGYTGIDSFMYQICDPVDRACDTIISYKDSAWVVIRVEGCVIPNAISPNGDGINDVFEIPCAVGNVELNVYNRWGIEVYREGQYMNDWDGRYKGSPLPDGTYYYVVKFFNESQEEINKAGFITLHR
ncbi:MAG TPA: gliding motility-associated C-terminal domain-containing protein, partial [Chitinophagales bacterium]|nr:gliding motility-associated C-terminal domain-containing protein [Chitinophagales bacterium]